MNFSQCNNRICSEQSSQSTAMANNVMDAFESSLQEIFNEFDTDNVGYLTLTQLEDCVESMGISDVQTFNLSKYTTNDPPTFALQHLRHIIQLPFIQQNGNDTTNDDIISVFNSIDVSKSGRISAADFENFLRANDVPLIAPLYVR